MHARQRTLLLVLAGILWLGGVTSAAAQTTRKAAAAPDPPWQDRREFLRDGLRQSEGFRRGLLSPDSSGGVRGQLIAEAIERFPALCRGALEGRPNLDDFRVRAAGFLKQIRGEVRLEGAAPFDAFAGRWYGLWDRMPVDHHWHPAERWDPPRQILAGLPPVLAAQYAWVGDGFCWSYFARPSGRSSGSVVLGMVYHVDPADGQTIRRRRPHVGYYDGPARLIWVTSGEIFFEQVLPPQGDQPEHYAITGFFYTIHKGRLSSRGDAFQAVYSHAEHSRRPWFRFPIDLAVPQ